MNLSGVVCNGGICVEEAEIQRDLHIVESDSSKRATATYLAMTGLKCQGAADISGLDLAEITRHDTVLLVEDSAPVRAEARRGLEDWGYTVFDQADGAAAVAFATEHTGPIYLLVTDVVMPGMSGRELAERLTAARPSMKVLYTSGHTYDDLVRQGVLNAGVDFLQKPAKPETLGRKVRAMLPLGRIGTVIADLATFTKKLTVAKSLTEGANIPGRLELSGSTIGELAVSVSSFKEEVTVENLKLHGILLIQTRSVTRTVRSSGTCSTGASTTRRTRFTRRCAHGCAGRATETRSTSCSSSLCAGSSGTRRR